MLIKISKCFYSQLLSFPIKNILYIYFNAHMHEKNNLLLTIRAIYELIRKIMLLAVMSFIKRFMHRIE